MENKLALMGGEALPERIARLMKERDEAALARGLCRKCDRPLLDEELVVAEAGGRYCGVCRALRERAVAAMTRDTDTPSAALN